jgi:hypothetical protein
MPVKRLAPHLGWLLLLGVAAFNLEATPKAGNVFYSVPPGWSVSETEGSTVLTPPGLGPGEVCVIRLFPGEELFQDFGTWFTQKWLQLAAGMELIEGGQVRNMRSPRGVALLTSAAVLQAQNGAKVFVYYFAANPGRRVEYLFFMGNSRELFDRYQNTAGDFIIGLHFANVEPNYQPSEAESPGTMRPVPPSAPPAGRTGPAAPGPTGPGVPSSRVKGGEDYWKPDTQVGDFQFNLPDGWKKMQTRDGTILVPANLSGNTVVTIGFLPAETPTGDPRSWFASKWAEWQRQFKVLQAGEVETSHNSNGFDVLSVEARVTNQRVGYSQFVFAAAEVGNRVEPYYFMCNTSCYDERDAFDDFQHGLTFANLKSSRLSEEGTGTAGGLKGLYVGWRWKGAYEVKIHLSYVVFFPDGNVIRYLPKEGLENFDFGAALRKSRDSCGRYRMNGNRFTITWGNHATEPGVREGAKLQIGEDGLDYQLTARSDGLKLNGNYHPERSEQPGSIRFTPDGHFTENGVLKAVDYAGPDFSPGTGSYHIKDNTLTLSYDDGRSIAVSFFVFADEDGSHQPKLIHLNTYALQRGTSPL